MERGFTAIIYGAHLLRNIKAGGGGVFFRCDTRSTRSASPQYTCHATYYTMYFTSDARFFPLL